MEDGKRKVRALTTFFGIMLLAVAALFAVSMVNKNKREALIHNNASLVMPFKLDATTHLFKLTIDGGLQQVVVKDASNQTQVELIRRHLKMESQKFSQGDFSDPASIHGKNMPGLSTLVKSASNIVFNYVDLPDGGQITYSASDPKIIKAIHDWFDAQLSDHGKDAMSMK